MIVYFADRQFNILGHASTNMRKGLMISDDLKSEDVDTGVAVFECRVSFGKNNRKKVENCVKVGNYLLRSGDGKNEFYTIIDSESDTKNQEVYIYAEDAGLDLLNEVVGKYAADQAYPIAHYVNKFAYDSGFVIGINEISNLTRKLSWDGEATCTERLASVATQFDNAEISYSFDIKGLAITNKYINIHKKRGQDIGIQLRLNQEIDRIVTKTSIANLATSLEVTGGTPENAESPITLSGYKYDDGDIYVAGTRLNSRSALKNWSRYVWNNEPNKQGSDVGHITKPYSYDTTSQKELCAHAVTQLKKICNPEVNYEVDIVKLPENARIGDTVYIIDTSGELYLSTRLLQLEVSETKNTRKATLGDFLIKGSGISQKVIELAEKFSKISVSASRALMVANNAKGAADTANEQAETALQGAQEAKLAAETAQNAADTATISASNAQIAADDAKEAVGVVEQNVLSLETSLEVAQEAAENAQKAAETADAKAVEAKEAALEAQRQTVIAKESVDAAQVTAQEAVLNASNAQDTADAAKAQAVEAQATAQAAKTDAEQANKDIASLGESLETLSSTMSVEYARKTDLTAAEAALQTQITQNASEISSTAQKVQTIDETANNAAEQAALAQTTAAAAQSKADQASADAVTAQTKADEAATAAANAQSEADRAKQAATTAKTVADQAEAALAAAQADLETVSSRVDATEEEIAAAQLAVETAQTAADQAKADAEDATTKAENAQTVANTAMTDAATAQTAANDAASKAVLAQQTADTAKGDAAAAQAKANEAVTAASEAQRTADTAKTNAAAAQTAADTAAAQALAAQTAADNADAKAVQAATDLETAKKNLSDVASRVDATVEEVEAAQAAVIVAQKAADKAQADAVTAQNTANTAKANAATAQTAANTAKTAADNAQKAADEAQIAADNAQKDVDALAVRTTSAETKIQQNSEQIALRATKTEVAETLGGYYTKAESDAAIKVVSDAVALKVSTTDFNSYKTTVTGQISTAKNEAISTAASDATTKANNAKSAAISAAASDATTKANNALSSAKSDATTKANNALASAKSYTDAEITVVNESLTTTNQEISVMKGQIALKVEQTDIDTAVANVVIGGRNLLKLSNRHISNTTYAIADYYFGNSAPESGQTYTLTLKGELGSDRTEFRAYNTGGTVELAILTAIGDGLYRATFAWKISTSSTTVSNTYLRIYQFKNTGTSASTIEWIKLEKGNKATDWTPAPEDVDASITAVDNKFANYSTTAQMNAAITAKANEINLSVSQTYATKDNVTGIDTRLKTAESNITAQASSIALCVKEADVTGNYLIGKINLSSTTATIAAKHINLAGAVTISSLASDAKTKLDTASSNASTALSNAAAAQSAADAAKLLTEVETISSNMKKFKNVCGYTIDSANVKGALIITTPIMPSRMVSMRVRGYNYVGGSETIDLTIGFYNYSSSIANYGFMNNGSMKFSSIQVAKVSSSDQRAVVIIGDANTVWQYPKIVVEEVITGYSTACPDSYKDGFSATITASIPTYVQTTAISGTDLKTTANTAIANAASAQSTANTAVTNAAAAQNTANTAVSNAATAQSTANTANARATYHYGTCSTAAATAAKVGTMSGFVLYAGAKISIKFTNANTVANPTLNVNSTGAKTIRANGSNLAASSKYNWRAGSIVNFVYDGTYWVMEESTANYLWASNNDVTKIDGGNIYTKSIKAAAIDVEDLFAQNITATNLHVTGTSSFEGDIIAKSLSMRGLETILFDFGAGLSEGAESEYFKIITNDSAGNIAYLTAEDGIISLKADPSGKVDYNYILVEKSGITFHDGSAGSISVADLVKLNTNFNENGGMNLSGQIIGNYPTSSFVANQRDLGFKAVSTVQPSVSVSFGVGSGGYNRGIYDNVSGGWMIYKTQENQTWINNAVTSSGVYTRFAGHIVVMRLYGARPGTVPNGYRPSATQSVHVIWGNGTSFYNGWIVVNTNGTLTYSYIKDDHTYSTPTTAFNPYGIGVWII